MHCRLGEIQDDILEYSAESFLFTIIFFYLQILEFPDLTLFLHTIVCLKPEMASEG